MGDLTSLFDPLYIATYSLTWQALNTLTLHDGTDPVLAVSLWAWISADDE